MDFDADNYSQPAEPVRTWPTRVTGGSIVFICVLLLLSLFSYNIGEMGWSALNPAGHKAAAAVPCTNLLGTAGLYLAGILYALLGAAAGYTLVLLALMGISMIMTPQRRRLGQWVALIIMIICASSFLSIQRGVLVEWSAEHQLKSPGGLLGYFDGECVAAPLLGDVWAMVLMLTGHAIALIYFAKETPSSVGHGFWTDARAISRKFLQKYRRKEETDASEAESWKTATPSEQPAQTQPDFFDDKRTEPEPRNRMFPPQSVIQRQAPAELHHNTPAVASPPVQQAPQPVAPQGQLPPRVRPTIQTAPPSLVPHDDRPASRTNPDPYDSLNRDEEERVPSFTPTPAPQRRVQAAPAVPPIRTPRPAEKAPRHLGNGDNLLDLMPEVEDEIVRRTSTDVEDEEIDTPPARSRMPLSPAAQAAFLRFKGFNDDNEATPPEEPASAPEETPAFQPREDERPLRKPTPRPVSTPTINERPGITERMHIAAAAPRTLPEDSRDMLEDYPLPPYDLLNYRPPAEEDTAAARDEMFNTQQNIIETFSYFKIDVEPGDITRGPSITRYEFYPPKGLKLSRISNLADNLKMATQSKSINILAPIPGKNTVGIELENDIKSPVYLRELLQSEAFHSPKLRIPVALGKDVYGSPVIGDLAAMPHTLVAGTTGSGKSVCVNSMILSMLYKFRPDELRLILVDPKVVEMQPYKKLPHLACPVVTNAARVIGALRWAVNEMEHRYKLFSKIGVRNFEDFNNRPEDFEPEPEEEEVVQQYNSLPNGFDAADAIVRDIEDSQGSEYLPEEEEQGEFDFDADERIPAKLPYIVIIIDELADLMMQVKEDLENYIARLTQKARAAGIHLVAATQTPRANVITGIIKANIPSRLAFKVASPLDSRVILDTNGAENLLGKGDFLFLPPGGVTKMTRAQGAFVSDPEIASIVKFCAAHAKQNFVQGVTAEMNNAEGGCADGSSDNSGRLGGNGMNDEDAELYTRCVNLVITERKASTSMLQRRFSIGYGRAAKMMDMMEARGVIGPASGNTSRPREVLIEAPE